MVFIAGVGSAVSTPTTSLTVCSGVHMGYSQYNGPLLAVDYVAAPNI